MMWIFKNRIIIAAIILFLVEIAGAFVITAPAMVFLRTQFSKSDLAHDLWPLISPRVISDILINDLQALVVIVLSAMVIYIMYLLLKTFFLGGIYDFVIRTSGQQFPEFGNLKSFLSRCTAFWPGFLKISILGIVVYGIALFLGISFGQIFARFGITWRILSLLFFILIGSSYLQILRARIVADDNTSVRHAMRSTRSIIAERFVRIVIGNVSVGIVAIIEALVFWLILKGIRHYNWSFFTAFLSIIFEQAIIFALCIMSVVRINFNYSIMRPSKMSTEKGSDISTIDDDPVGAFN
jgi:hypothetical protein